MLDNATDLFGDGRFIQLIHGSSELLVLFVYLAGITALLMALKHLSKQGQVGMGAAQAWPMSAIGWNIIAGIACIYFGSTVNAFYETAFVESAWEIEGGSPLSWSVDDADDIAGLDSAQIALKTAVQLFQFLGGLGVFLGLRQLKLMDRNDLGPGQHGSPFKAFWHIVGGVIMIDPINSLDGAGYFIPLLGDISRNMADAIN